MLSEGAGAESVPNLEIETNDVRCSHASAVGPIDEEQRYYLESRGVPPEVAERLIVLGFFGEVLDRLPAPVAIAGLRATLAAGWPERAGGTASRDAGHHRSGCARSTTWRPGTAKRFDVGKHRICLVRIGDDFYAIGDRCSHADFSLSEGEIWPDEREIECWKHGSTFSLEHRRAPVAARPPCRCPSTRCGSTTATSWSSSGR